MTIILYYDIIPSPCSQWHVTNPMTCQIKRLHQSGYSTKVRLPFWLHLQQQSGNAKADALILRFEHQSSWNKVHCCITQRKQSFIYIWKQYDVTVCRWFPANRQSFMSENVKVWLCPRTSAVWLSSESQWMQLKISCDQKKKQKLVDSISQHCSVFPLTVSSILVHVGTLPKAAG